MSNSRGDFIWYELMSSDTAGAATFYAALTGWTAQPFGDDGGYQLWLKDGEGVGGMLALTPDMVAGGARPGWLGYIHVPDVDATTEAIVNAGGSVHLPPQDIADVGRFAMVADPQGGVFYVMTPDGASDEPSRAFAPDVGHCGWNELSTGDPEGALAFYTALFGWKAGEAVPMGPDQNYQLVRQGDQDIGAISPIMAEGQDTAWLYYFNVANIDDALATIPAEGGTVMHGPHPVPGDAFIVIGADPQGAIFAVVGPRA